VKDVRASIQLQNLESGLHRGSITGTLSYPLTKHFSIYAQYFNGYGQSLIEYNHATQGIGIGIAFNDWI
jgi:phospholipase A1